MPSIVTSFVLGFVLAQAGWWIAARGASPDDPAAFGGAPVVRFALLAGVEILVAAVAFGIVLAIAAQGRVLLAVPKARVVSFLAGAATSTIAAGPFALIPPVIHGEGMLFVYIVAGGLISAAFAALVGRAFRGEAPADN
ncbi:MAG TPA: hypothetical protein VFJ62_14100 [Usitatibacter sp.]|nr:hypothetical protein [Usitatibacter sp.]